MSSGMAEEGRRGGISGRKSAFLGLRRVLPRLERVFLTTKPAFLRSKRAFLRSKDAFLSLTGTFLWPERMFLRPENVFSGQSTRSPGARMRSPRRRACLLRAGARVLWPEHVFSGRRTCSPDWRTCAPGREHVRSGLESGFLSLRNVCSGRSGRAHSSPRNSSRISRARMTAVAENKATRSSRRRSASSPGAPPADRAPACDPPRTLRLRVRGLASSPGSSNARALWALRR